MAQSLSQIADSNARFDHFAELLSLDMPMVDIRERMGLSRGGAAGMLKRLRDKYGWQSA